jgi:hypothetical protein
VVHNKTLVKFHYLHKVELVALWAAAGILPDQGVSVEMIATIAPPANELIGTPSKAFLEETTHLVVPSTNTGVALKKHRDERAFEHSAWCVKCYQLINLTSPREVIPMFVNALRLFVRRHPRIMPRRTLSDLAARLGSVALRDFSPKTRFRPPMGSLFHKGFRFTDKSVFW